MSNASSVYTYLNNLGYDAQGEIEKPASYIYNNMPYNSINIIHGHGMAGAVRCELTNGAYTWLYSYPRSVLASQDASFGNYNSTSLSRSKLLLYIACESAVSLNGYSMASAGYAKGAKCSIGFNNSVVGGDDWMRLFFQGLSQNKTIQQSRDYADAMYKQDYPIYDESESPAGHSLKWGNANVRLRV